MLARALQQCSAKHYHHYGSKIITGSFSRRIRLASAAAFLAIAVISSPSSLTICDAAPLNRLPAAVTARNTILLEKLRPASNQYTRIDEGPLMKKENQAWVNDHAIHGTLNKESGIELYEIYKCNNSDDILCIIKFGSSLNGYPGVVHGGITALMFDNSFGWLLQASNAPPAVTANLEVNYRKPVLPNTYAVLKAKFISREGRKIFLMASLHDSEGVLLANSTALFIKLKFTAQVMLYASKVLKAIGIQL